MSRCFWVNDFSGENTEISGGLDNEEKFRETYAHSDVIFFSPNISSSCFFVGISNPKCVSRGFPADCGLTGTECSHPEESGIWGRKRGHTGQRDPTEGPRQGEHLVHMCQTQGLRAESGPPGHFVWPSRVS